jgi:hypothetical protein
MAGPIYVPQTLWWNQDQLDERMNALGGITDNTITQIIVMIDYAYSLESPNYDGGLSIFDRINDKLGKYADEEIEEIKNGIRNDPASYMDEMYRAWTIPELEYYGI